MTMLRHLGATLFLCVVCTSCANNIHLAYVLDPNYEPVTEDTRFASRFSYDAHPIDSNERIDTARSTSLYRLNHVTIPSIGVNGQKGNLLQAEFFESTLAGKKPLVVVLPVYGSHRYPSRVITNGLRKRSQGQVNIVRILGDDFLFDWNAMGEAASEGEFMAVLDRMVARVTVNVIDIRRYIDWALARSEIDSERIVLIGFSSGALVGGAVLTTEDRITTAVLIMGGANPHEIFAACPGRARTTREKIMRRLGWSKQKFEAKTEQAFNPVNVALSQARVPPDKIIVFDSAFDRCIPETARDAFWNAMGRPERRSLLYDHKVSFLSMTPLGLNFMRRKIYEFLEAQDTF